MRKNFRGVTMERKNERDNKKRPSFMQTAKYKKWLENFFQKNSECLPVTGESAEESKEHSSFSGQQVRKVRLDNLLMRLWVRPVLCPKGTG